jgi:hypothetical protein
MDYSVNTPGTNLAAVYDTFMFESPDAAYLAQVARLRSSRPAHLSPISPVKLAVDKNKLWFVDQDGVEFEAKILKQVQKQGTQPAPVSQVAQQAAPNPPVPPQPAPKPTVVAAVKPAPAPKPEPVAVAKVQKPEAAPKPEPAPKPAAAAAPKAEPVTVAKLQKPDPVVARPAPAPAPVATPKPKPEPKPEPKTEPTADAAAPRPIKDRAWQSGQLLSTVSNQYFVNVSYTTESEGSTWNMSQGSDGRLTLVSLPKTYATNSTYDNYVIESQFCAYLVQRWRPKTAPMVRFPGTTPLKFAVDKNKVYVLDEDGKEYETRIVKLVQRDAIDTHTRIVSR